jgi:hypothetical protein
MEMLDWDNVATTIAIGVALVAGAWLLIVALRAAFPRVWFRFRRPNEPIVTEHKSKPPRAVSAW